MDMTMWSLMVDIDVEEWIIFDPKLFLYQPRHWQNEVVFLVAERLVSV